MLRHVPSVSDPRVLIDAAMNDDAAVYQLTDDRALVATVDFFTPIVDDAYTFGRIAAANAFSDLYAMGATPLMALNLVAWHRAPDMLELLGEAIRGAQVIADEAGAFVLGGHSIDDPEPKLGMVAIGDVHPKRLITNAGAKPGDMLVLTKPIGTGILSTALKRDKLTEQELEPAIRSMTTLNAGAARAMREVGDAVHAVTDVTGFGLLGHLRNMLDASGLSAAVDASQVPAFERVRELIGDGVVPGGTERNVTAANEFTSWSEGVDEITRVLLNDAQTSGGLLIAVDPSARDRLVAALKTFATPVASVIGEMTQRQQHLVAVS